MAQPFFYDRVNIYIGTQQYLPNGQIRRFRMTGVYGNATQPGMSGDGTAAGVVVGNMKLAPIEWEEYLQNQADLINWNQFLQAAPNTIITVVPFTIVTGQPAAPAFAISQLVIQRLDVDAAGGFDAMPIKRTCTFEGVSATNF